MRKYIWEVRTGDGDMVRGQFEDSRTMGRNRTELYLRALAFASEAVDYVDSIEVKPYRKKEDTP